MKPKPSQLQKLDAAILAKRRQVAYTRGIITELRRQDPEKPVRKGLIVQSLIDPENAEREKLRQYTINRQHVALIDVEIANLRKRKKKLLADNDAIAGEIF